jgi:hypothetical protein
MGAVFLPSEQHYVESFTLQAGGTYRLRIPFGLSNGNGMSKELTTNQFGVQ